MPRAPETSLTTQKGTRTNVKRVLLKWIIAFAVLISAGAALAQLDSVLAQARQLMQRSDPAAAYNLLKPLEADRAGNPDFDYLLGIAALDSGRYTEAVFALERVLAVNPKHVQARAEIARALVQLGEVEAARREFETVHQQSIPPEAAATIQKYLDAIEQIQADTRTAVAGYVELGLGYDTNVNSGTTTSQFAVPALPGLGVATLNPAALKQEDGFGYLAAGANVRHPVNPSLALIAAVDGSQRLHFDKTDFDLGNVAVNLGAEVTHARNRFLFALQGQQMILDWNRFRDSFGGVAQWQHQLGNGVFTAYLQHARLDYPGQEIRNADRTVGGIAYAHAFTGRYAPVLFAGAYYGHENERNSSRPDFGHRLTGVRVGGQLTLTEGVTAFVFGSYEDRNYGGPVPGFIDDRADEQTDFRLGLSYKPAKLWTITPQVAYTENKSNVPFTDYDRAQALITVRRDFR
ncbi:MAG: surface lipoprotein assembly modifier [Burkholderiales bacterium]